MTTSASTALAGLNQAVGQVHAALGALADGRLPAGHAAYFALLVEELGAELSRAQIHAADAVRRSGAHKLDNESLAAITAAGPETTPEHIEQLAGHTVLGRTAFTTSLDLLHSWLNIPVSTARDRLYQVDCLVAQVNDAGQRTAPMLPQLAHAFGAKESDPRLVIAAARKIRSRNKDLGTGKAADARRASLEKDAVQLINEHPESARKHINDLVDQAVAGKRTWAAMLAEIGLYRSGLRRGLVHFRLVTLPQHAEFIESALAQIDNPKTMAGNREALKDLARHMTRRPAAHGADDGGTAGSAEDAATDATPMGEYGAATDDGEERSEWDDESTMPDWAREPGAADSEARPAPAGSAQQPDEAGPDEAGPEQAEPDEAETDDAEPPEESTAPLEDVRPEFRHLLALLQLLSPTPGGRTRAGVIVPEISVILDYDKMVADGKDFGVTASGIPLSAGEARSLLCCGKIRPIVLSGRGEILDVGRTRRLFPKPIVRAVRAVYRGCMYPGCTMPASRCEADHLDPWEDGGETCVENCGLWCKIHHISRHCEQFTAVRIPGSRPLVLLPPGLDPEQRLQVNTYFMTPQEALKATAWANEATELWHAGQLEVVLAAA